MSIVWIILALGLVAAIQAALAAAFGLWRVTYDRRFSVSRAFEGEKVELVEVIANHKLLPIPWIRAESRMSPALRFGHGAMSEEREISADRYHKSAFYLGPFSRITRRHEVTCLKRGHYDIGSVALTTGDALGLTQKSRQLNLDCAIDVFPRFLSEEELSTPSTRWQGELSVRRWIMPDPFLVTGIRGYQPGDPLRDVHWGATARTGALQVKTRDYTADPRVMVVLNVQATEEQWGDLMDYEQESIEAGIRIAATLCRRALDVGAEAGFAANACLYGEKGTGRTIIVPAERGEGQLESVLTAMARMEIHREATFHTFLESLTDLHMTDILILSMYDSDAIRLRVRLLEASGSSVTFMPLERRKKREADRTQPS